MDGARRLSDVAGDWAKKGGEKTRAAGTPLGRCRNPPDGGGAWQGRVGAWAAAIAAVTALFIAMLEFSVVQCHMEAARAREDYREIRQELEDLELLLRGL